MRAAEDPARADEARRHVRGMCAPVHAEYGALRPRALSFDDTGIHAAVQRLTHRLFNAAERRALRYDELCDTRHDATRPGASPLHMNDASYAAWLEVLTARVRFGAELERRVVAEVEVLERAVGEAGSDSSADATSDTDLGAASEDGGGGAATPDQDDPAVAARAQLWFDAYAAAVYTSAHAATQSARTRCDMRISTRRTKESGAFTTKARRALCQTGRSTVEFPA